MAFLLILLFLNCVLAGDTSASPSCSNEAVRTEQAATALPECRAYELVSPAEKDSGEPRATVAGLRESSLYSEEGMYSSEAGNRMAWTSEYPLPGSSWSGLDYLSTRGITGWATENVIPPQSVSNGTDCPAVVAIAGYSADLSTAVLADGFAQVGSFKGEALQCGHDEPRLASGELQGFQNLFARDDETRSYRLIDVTPAGAPIPTPAPENEGQYFPAAFLAGSSDLSVVVFEEELPLVPDAPAGDDLYEWSRASGTVSLVSRLPDGTPAPGMLADATRNAGRIESTQEFVPFNVADSRHAVSADGSRIFFLAAGNLYLRENGASTTEIDLTQGGSGTAGGGGFMLASQDGTKAIFTDESRLTVDSHAEVGKPDLYEYDLDKPLGDRLTDITATTGQAADVLGLAGGSTDASYVYYVADGVLASARPNGEIASGPILGQPNLYLYHDGVTTFVASLAPNADYCDWSGAPCGEYPLFGGSTVRASPDGRFVAFDSAQSLTGYNNAGPKCVPGTFGGTVGTVENYSPGPCEEIYRYGVEANKLDCVSCDPDGHPPIAPATLRFPVQASQDREMTNSHLQRNVADSGAVFFESQDSLVAPATNAAINVYVYEDGQPHLISSGVAEADSYFLEASQDGSNVFFATSQSLLAETDEDQAYDIYDARIAGGFAEPAAPAAPCEDESSCAGPVGRPPVFTIPGSVTFVGPGNPAASSEATVAPAGKTVRHHTAKKRRRKRTSRSAARRDKRHARRAAHGGDAHSKKPQARRQRAK
ncbi:MAG TPA: hypothetical protein VFW38_03080 [Solirubrobacteraceae bacterium]|nr:hypothetical protein [Solirubrobacteraceae bacterium]